MNKFKLIPFLLIFLCFSCKDNDDTSSNLLGVWKFGSCFVDGVGTPAEGTISFNSDIPSQMDLWYIVENDTISKQGEFSYSETNEELSIELATDNYTWTKAVDKRNEQEFQFKETVNQIEYNIVFDLIPE